LRSQKPRILPLTAAPHVGLSPKQNQPMHTSRRKFITTTMRHTAGASLITLWAGGAKGAAAVEGEPAKSFTLLPIGRVEKKGQSVGIRIFEEYADGLLGLEGWSHLNVFYWFDRNDTPQQRRVLRVHPRGDKQNPLTGVFACRAPVRPNLIALSVCKIVSVRANLITVSDLDAFDATPVLDLKPFIPPDAPAQDLRVPAWARERRPSGS
jgi:tRNA (adenine37-N6)-methyltransferase